MILFIILFSVLGLVEIKYKPRVDYLKKEKLFLIFYSAGKNERKLIKFKLWI